MYSVLVNWLMRKYLRYLYSTLYITEAHVWLIRVIVFSYCFSYLMFLVLATLWLLMYRVPKRSLLNKASLLDDKSALSRIIIISLSCMTSFVLVFRNHYLFILSSLTHTWQDGSPRTVVYYFRSPSTHLVNVTLKAL